MKKFASSLVVSVSKINKTHVQLIFTLIMLGLLVLGAGAPEGFGGVGR